MFGDIFGTKADYSKGILYTCRHEFLRDPNLPPSSAFVNLNSTTNSLPSIGPGMGKLWEDGNKFRAPTCLRSKRQMRRELLRKNDVSTNTLPPLRHLKFLEKIQEHVDHDNSIRNILLQRSQQTQAAMEKKKIAAAAMMKTEKTKIPLLSALIPSDVTVVRRGSLKNRKTSASVPPTGIATPAGAVGAVLPLNNMTREAVLRAEKEEQQRLSWVYITGKGHPYW